MIEIFFVNINIESIWMFCIKYKSFRIQMNIKHTKIISTINIQN